MNEKVVEFNKFKEIKDEKDLNSKFPLDSTSNRIPVDKRKNMLYNEYKEGDNMSELNDKRMDMLIEMQKDSKQDMKDIENRLDQHMRDFTTQANIREERYFKDSKEREERLNKTFEEFDKRIDKRFARMEKTEDYIKYSWYANLLALVALVFGFFYFIFSYFPNIIANLPN